MSTTNEAYYAAPCQENHGRTFVVCHSSHDIVLHTFSNTDEDREMAERVASALTSGRANSAVIAFLRRIAETPKAGEPCSEAPQHLQSWTDEGGVYAIEILHDLIDSARALLPPPAASN
ncbi:hypothetical protein V5F40_22880 [Xanthobacter sp. DSM 14520]|uniref:hypothetical protein n=1 Tax=Xanthobacter autotrophicus (strain ATCC BAA-1158 / Py2) TaxID=78245 RepID=UPI003727EB1A